MRQAFAVIVLAGTFLSASASEDASVKVEVKGPHICCKQCVNIVGKILAKVDGVTEVKSDIKMKTITYTAKNDAAAKAGIKALFTGGFFGAATAGGRDLKVDLATVKKGNTVDKVAVKDVHVCCGQCENAITKLFASMGATATFSGTGAQRTVNVEKAASLEQSAVLESLRKTGFNGTIVEK